EAGRDHPVRGQAGDIRPLEHDAPAPRRREPQDRADQGGLARAVGAEQAGNLAARYRERDVLEHVRPVVGGVQVLDREGRGRAHAAPRYASRTCLSAATSWYAPSAILRPKLSTTQRSVMRSITSMWCSMMMIVSSRKRCFTSRMSSMSRCVPSRVIPAE